MVPNDSKFNLPTKRKNLRNSSNPISPKNTDEEKEKRKKAMDAALKDALKIPYEIVTICCNMVKIAGKLIDIGNKNLISDVGCGVLFLDSAIKSAEMNVDINLKYIKDKSFVDKTLSDMKSLVSDDLMNPIRSISLFGIC